MAEVPLEDDLQDAIRRLYGCESILMESHHVVETFRGQTAWEGTVYVFDLAGHPDATRCYAWRHETESKSRRYVVVLHLPPVDSPVSAVRAALAQEIRKRRDRG